MQPQFAANSTPLGRLFREPFQIETPDYQRPFVWTEAEAGRLLEDLCAAAEADATADGGEQEPCEIADYFLGTILLVDRNSAAARAKGWPLEGPARAFEVVDGLQRLTTLCLLFCALRDIASGNGEPSDRRVLGAITSAASPAGRPWLRLRESDEAFFQAEVRRHGKGEVREAPEGLSPSQARIVTVRDLFFKSLGQLDAEQRARLAAFLLDRVFVVLITTTGIDRAHRMFMVLNERGKPLARNDILKADHLGRAGPAAAPQVAAAWDDMEARLGDEFESLFSHVRAMYGKPTGPVISSIRSLGQQAGGAQRFVVDVLKPAADALDDIRHNRAGRWPHRDEVAQTLAYLNWLPSNDWVPPAMLYWQSAATAPSSMLEFLKALDRLAHGLKFLGMGASKRATRYGAVAAAIRQNENVLAPGGPMALTGQEERSIRYNLQDLHARAPLMAKLVLLRLNDRIAGRAQNLAAGDWTVEHVLPRKHAPSSQWRTWFQDPGERGACTESLGNLLLVTKAQNDKAANFEFARKQSVYFQADVPVPALNEPLRGLTEWRPADVLAREALLNAHLDAIWAFGLTAERAQGQPAADARRPQALSVK